MTAISAAGSEAEECEGGVDMPPTLAIRVGPPGVPSRVVDERRDDLREAGHGERGPA
ncbi:hypothetical protein Arub01_19800 [Actinomadura rubrobrunea]|uniref:Uncharacterized protein n=1 Tax=Actinomadura rubrobrunea TaxID=115335 RepID=A0A9W6UTK8_9ACTN|nr:hypothetical protein Arub01_19800 [Actinomadura rubrobrunea]